MPSGPLHLVQGPAWLGHVNSDPRRQPLTKPIYSFSMSASQGIETPTVTCIIGYAEEGKSRHHTVTWDLPNAVNADGVETEWLYAVLSRVLQDFDDHHVVRSVFETYGQPKEAPRATS